MMQVISICRFSYPAEGGVQREHKSLEERCAYLHDPTRLNVRFNCLETLTLPSIRGQSDADFTFAILIGDSLPEAAKDRLKTLTADIPQVQIIERESGPYRQITQEVVDSLRLPDAELCAQFRLDDDDAVGLQFVEDIRTVTEKSSRLLDFGGKMAVDFSTGFAVRPGKDGLRGALLHQQLWTPGLAIVMRPHSKRSILNYGHHKLHQEMPTVTIPDKNMFVRSFHGDNDSLAVRIGATYDYQSLDQFTVQYFKETFNIDNDAVKAAWSDD